MKEYATYRINTSSWKFNHSILSATFQVKTVPTSVLLYKVVA